MNDIPEILVLTVLLTGLKGIFGAKFGFVLGFFIKLALLFLASAVISKLLHLEKAYNHTADHEKKNNN